MCSRSQGRVVLDSICCGQHQVIPICQEQGGIFYVILCILLQGLPSLKNQWVIWIQKYQYKNIWVFPSKHILLHSSECWFWKWLYASDPKVTIGLLVTSKGKTSTAGLLRFLYSSVLSFESKENIEKEIILNQLDCNSVRILKTWSKIKGQEGCSVMGFWNFHDFNICLMMLFFFFYFKFLWKSLKTVQPCNILDHECQLLIAGFWKIEVLESPISFIALEYSAKECWTATKKDKLPATKGLSFKDIQYHTSHGIIVPFFYVILLLWFLLFILLCSLTPAMEHEPYLHCLCELQEHLFGVKNTAHFIHLWVVEVIFTARWQ